MVTKTGYWKGQHFTVYVDEVKALKKADRHAEAVELLGHLVDATERESATDRIGVAPWYYEQLAIIHRKLGDAAAERAVLERFAARKHAPGVKPGRLLERLEKMRSRDSRMA